MPWSHGQRAQLLTSRQELTTAPRCLSFWYRLAGPQIGTCPMASSQGAPAWLHSEGSGVPKGCGMAAPRPPLPRYPEPQAAAGERGGRGAVDQPRDPGQHLAPGMGDTACHGPAVVPGEDQTPMSLAPARHGASDTAAWGQVAFEVLHDGFLGDVGLDDLTQTAGPCGAELSCSFEVEGCALAASGKGTWQRQSNGTGTTAGPAADHTTGTAAGTGPRQPCCFPAALSVLPACSECPACTPHQPCLLSLCPACPPQDEQKAMLPRAPQPWDSPNPESPSPRAP